MAYLPMSRAPVTRNAPGSYFRIRRGFFACSSRSLRHPAHGHCRRRSLNRRSLRRPSFHSIDSRCSFSLTFRSLGIKGISEGSRGCGDSGVNFCSPKPILPVVSPVREFKQSSRPRHLLPLWKPSTHETGTWRKAAWKPSVGCGEGASVHRTAPPRSTVLQKTVPRGKYTRSGPQAHSGCVFAKVRPAHPVPGGAFEQFAPYRMRSRKFGA